MKQKEIERINKREELKTLKILLITVVMALSLLFWVLSYCVGTMGGVVGYYDFPGQEISMKDWIENEESRFEPYPYGEK